MNKYKLVNITQMTVYGLLEGELQDETDKRMVKILTINKLHSHAINVQDATMSTYQDNINSL